MLNLTSPTPTTNFYMLIKLAFNSSSPPISLYLLKQHLPLNISLGEGAEKGIWVRPTSFGMLSPS